MTPPPVSHLANPEADFLAEMTANGIDYHGQIIADGELHRFKANGDKNPNAWYVLHTDGLPAGSFGDFKRNIQENWCAKASESLTRAERDECNRKWQQQAEEREAEHRRQHNAASIKAKTILDAARPATDDHPYLSRKRVRTYPGVKVGHWPQRQQDNCLLIPLHRICGEIATVQAIFPNKPINGGRDKDFLQDGAKRGAFFSIGDLAASKRILIAEGYATAATLHEATGYAAIAAFDAGNLRPVAEAMRAAYPMAQIMIAADNDRQTPGNPGLTKATEAANTVGGLLAVPPFVDGESGSDFNDLAALHGLAAVRNAVDDALRDRVQSEPSTRYQAEAVSGLAGAVTNENLFSDYGNIVKLMERMRDRIAYTPGLDWLLYNTDTGIWEPEPGSERVKRIVMESLRESWGAIFDAAQQDVDGLKKTLKGMDADDPQAAMIGKKVKLATSRRDKVFAWLRQCETAYRIRSTLELAEGYFWTAPNQWDANPHILVCANGVLDLKSGVLLPHAPGYHATKTTGTEYRPNATHPAWDAAVELLKSEGDRYAFIQQFCGSGLHGANPNERVVIFQGDGGTGKGTLLTAIHNALGDYVATVEVGSLLATDWRKQNKSAPREDLLKLRGARFVYPSIEPPKDSKLDDGSIKALTGNDAITARYPHGKNSITFLPVFKLAIQTNFPLQTEFDDPGMKRRVIVVPFNQKPKRPDPTVKNALMHDPDARAAVLAWLYEGYRTWLQNDFALPESALAAEATAEYWADMNPYEQFARDVGLRFGNGLKCLKPRMTGAFKAWRDETGRRDAAIKGFPHWLKSMGCFDAQASDHQRYWYGVAFISDPQPQPQQPQQPQQPPVSGNMVVEPQYSTSTGKFHETGGYNGCYGYEPPQTGEIGEKIDKNGQTEGGNGRDGTVKPESALDKPPKGTFPHNPPNCPNHPKQPPSPPVETKLEADGDAVLSQHPRTESWGKV